MNRFLKAKSFLVIILILAAFLRLWNIVNVPPSASLDEASIEYNAYSVLKTGGDEYGEFPLISQRGYDDWRRSTYLFLVVPFVGLSGLNIVSVRLPAIILSILTVWATYHIALLLFSKPSEFSSNFALFTSFLLAISPWHIYISRLGHESNACLSFLVFGILFFLQGIRSNRWTLILISIIFFTFSMISYYSGQVFIPLFLVGLILIFRKNIISILKSDKKIIIVFLALLIILIPIFWTIFSPKALIRFQGTSTFKPEAHLEMFAKEVKLRNEAVKKHDIVGILVYNRHLFPVKVLIQGYVSHFNPQWLFMNSSGESFKAPNMGLLYMWQIPFIAIGIIGLIFSRFLDGKSKKLIILWFFLGSLPAAIATQVPHAMRSYNILPAWQIFTAFGLVYFFLILKKFNVLILVTFLFLVLVSLVTFYKNYFIIFPQEQSHSFQYSLSKTISYVLSQKKHYQKIVFSNKDSLYQSYMFFLFYSKYDPYLYQKQGGTISGGFKETHKFGKYEFRPIDWNKDKFTTNTLFIGNVSDFFTSEGKPKLFANLDGEITIKVIGIQ